jgi:hypothetical protein
MRLRLSGGGVLPEWLQDELYQLHPEPSDAEMLQLLIKDYIYRNGPKHEDLTPLGYVTRYALESRCEDGSLVFFNHDTGKSTWHHVSSAIVQAFNEREAELKNAIDVKWGSEPTLEELAEKFANDYIANNPDTISTSTEEAYMKDLLKRTYIAGNKRNSYVQM